MTSHSTAPTTDSSVSATPTIKFKVATVNKQSTTHINQTRIIIRVDEDVVTEFKSKAEKAGKNYHHLMNEALKQYLKEQILIDAIKDTIREELQGAT